MGYPRLAFRYIPSHRMVQNLHAGAGVLQKAKHTDRVLIICGRLQRHLCRCRLQPKLMPYFIPDSSCSVSRAHNGLTSISVNLWTLVPLLIGFPLGIWRLYHLIEPEAYFFRICSQTLTNEGIAVVPAIHSVSQTLRR